MTNQSKLTALGRTALFASLNASELEELAGLMTDHQVSAGDWLFHTGDEATSFFIVVSGRLEAVDETQDAVLRDVGPGEWIGEFGVIAGEARSAGVRAVRDSQLWAISDTSFTELLDRHRGIQRHVLRVLAQLLRQSRPAQEIRRNSIIGVVSTRRGISAQRMARALADSLRTYGNAETISLDMGDHGEAATRGELSRTYGELVDRAEAANDWVLMVVDHDSGDAWRDYVLDQADRLAFLIGREAPEAAVLPPLGKRCDLVITEQETSPEWWSALEPLSHHYVGARPKAADLAPLARRLAGRSLGLVMSGGGARGLAHFGVYSELVKAGVTLDRFGGASAGAIAAAGFAMGMSPDEALEQARRLFTHGNPLADYTIPAVALIKGQRIERLKKEIVGDSLIEELPKGFFSISADLITGKEIVHRRGSLWLAVRASLSIPGLLPPVKDGDRILVDGGLLNNLPADVMVADADGQAICVDLRRAFIPRRGYGLLPVQPPAVVRRLVGGTDEQLPSIQDTLIRSIDLAASARPLSDLPRLAAVIEPDVTRVGLLNFGQMNEAVEAGRIAARAALQRHPELVG